MPKNRVTLLLEHATVEADTQSLIEPESGENRLNRFLLAAGKFIDQDKKKLAASLRKRPVKLERDDGDDDGDKTLLVPRTDEELMQLAQDKLMGFLTAAGDKGADKVVGALQAAARKALDEAGEAADLGWIPGMVVSTALLERSALAIGAIVKQIRDTDPYYRLDDYDRDDGAGRPHRNAKSLKATLTLVALLMETKAAGALAAKGASLLAKAGSALGAVAVVGALAFIGPLLAPVIVAGAAAGVASATSKLVERAIKELRDSIRSVDRDAMAEELSEFAVHEALSLRRYDEQPEEERDPLKGPPPQCCREALTHLVPSIRPDYWDGDNASSRGAALIRKKLN